MIILVYYRHSYSLASVGTLIQTFHFYTLRITAKQANVQNSRNLSRSYIYLKQCPAYVLQTFSMLEMLMHVKYIPSDSAKTFLWAQNDAKRTLCQLKPVESHFSVGCVLLSSRWKPSWTTSPQVICWLESTARGNLACLVLYWQNFCRKWIKVAWGSINGNFLGFLCFGFWNSSALSHVKGNISEMSLHMTWGWMECCSTPFLCHLARPFEEAVPIEAAVPGSVLCPLPCPVALGTSTAGRTGAVGSREGQGSSATAWSCPSSGRILVWASRSS